MLTRFCSWPSTMNLAARPGKIRPMGTWTQWHFLNCKAIVFVDFYSSSFFLAKQGKITIFLKEKERGNLLILCHCSYLLRLADGLEQCSHKDESPKLSISAMRCAKQLLFTLHKISYGQGINAEAARKISDKYKQLTDADYQGREIEIMQSGVIWFLLIPT